MAIHCLLIHTFAVHTVFPCWVARTLCECIGFDLFDCRTARLYVTALYPLLAWLPCKMLWHTSKRTCGQAVVSFYFVLISFSRWVNH